MNKKIKSVCVYCGSSNKVDERYKQAARDVGTMVAAQGWGMVYGGSASGLMGLSADAALAAGGDVIGVAPAFLAHMMGAEKETVHHGLTELHIVETMHERKQKFVDLSDAFIVLPGGLGTLDELFEILVWRQLGVHSRPIVVANIGGYWDPLLPLIDRIVDSKFARESDKTQFVMADNIADIPDLLRNAPAPDKDLMSKWI